MQIGLHRRHPLADGVPALVAIGEVLCPPGEHVGEGQPPDVVPGAAIAAVGHRVRLDPAGGPDVAVLHLHWDPGAQERAGPGPAPGPFAQRGATGPQEPVDARRAHGQEPTPEPGIEPGRGGPRNGPATAGAPPPAACRRAARRQTISLSAPASSGPYLLRGPPRREPGAPMPIRPPISSMACLRLTPQIAQTSSNSRPRPCRPRPAYRHRTTKRNSYRLS